MQRLRVPFPDAYGYLLSAGAGFDHRFVSLDLIAYPGVCTPCAMSFFLLIVHSFYAVRRIAGASTIRRIAYHYHNREVAFHFSSVMVAISEWDASCVWSWEDTPPSCLLARIDRAPGRYVPLWPVNFLKLIFLVASTLTHGLPAQ